MMYDDTISYTGVSNDCSAGGRLLAPEVITETLHDSEQATFFGELSFIGRLFGVFRHPSGGLYGAPCFMNL